MKIAFVALTGTYEIDQIGGTDSYLRRLSEELVRHGHDVEWLFYGKEKESTTSKFGIKIKNFYSFSLLWQYSLEGHFDKTIIGYIKPLDRLSLFFKKLFGEKPKALYSLVFFYPDNLVKKIVRAMDVFFTGYDAVICASERLQHFNKIFSKKSFWLPPIIPRLYFNIGYAKLEKGIINEGPRVPAIFLGRLDPRKGINEIIKLIKDPRLTEKVNWTVSGIYIAEDKGNINALRTLKAMDGIEFHLEDRKKFSADVDNRVANFFLNNIFFLQPYTKLATTVDLPLLILEAQAAGCIVLTSLPNVLERYLVGKSIAFQDSYVDNTAKYLSHFQWQPHKALMTKDDLKNLESKYSADVVYRSFINILG